MHLLWKPYQKSESETARKYIQIELAGHTCLVRTERLPEGYLWQVDNQAGYTETLESAKLMAEATLERNSGEDIGS